ncbi:MAG: N-acetylmuramoyl-L-alanine amidase, partial [Candidatus Magasanikbacteria bacterium]|nr:N-acetylmuramoyl-L-alanine amidase [Candidatus Magasanikbacteria bacterium]
ELRERGVNLGTVQAYYAQHFPEGPAHKPGERWETLHYPFEIAALASRATGLVSGRLAVKTAVIPNLEAEAKTVSTSTVTEVASIIEAESLEITPRFLDLDAPDSRTGKTRRQLMLEYRRQHEGREARDTTIDPRMIVLHHTATADLDSALEIFQNVTLEGRPDIEKGGRVNVSAHYLIDQNGDVYQLLSDEEMARHIVGLNHVAIGIEMVGGDEDATTHDVRTPLTPAQIDAAARLVRHLKRLHPKISHLIGHGDYGAMKGHLYFREQVADYWSEKKDPAPEVMTAVRGHEAVADLKIKGSVD